MPNNARAIVREVLPRRMADEIWSAGYDKVLPVTVANFEISAVLPAVFYMFSIRPAPRPGQVPGDVLAGRENPPGAKARGDRRAGRRGSWLPAPIINGFDGDAEQAILGDLLLCFCLENSGRVLGRDKRVQRVAPAHYMASWIDLPDERDPNLRSVPVMIVAMLADQKGDHVEPNDDGDRTWFAVGKGHEDNLLLRAFSHGVKRDGPVADQAADRFDERCADIGIDQLLLIRLGRLIGSRARQDCAARKALKSQISAPLPNRAARDFSEDIRRFVRSYAGVVPRHAFVDLLESCVAAGMTAVLTSVVEILFEWAETGGVTERRRQQPAGILCRLLQRRR